MLSWSELSLSYAIPHSLQNHTILLDRNTPMILKYNNGHTHILIGQHDYHATIAITHTY